MEAFRVLVNLSHYFSDYRHKSWVYVDPNRYKTLSDLKKHISEVFAIDDDFEIFVCDSYIPSKEDVGIINGKDVLELRKSTGDADVTAIERDVFITPNSPGEESRKRKKKRRSRDLDSELVTYRIDVVDPLPENFHPESNSTMTSRKKRKETQSSSIEEFAESSSGDGSNKRRKKKSNLLKDKCWNAKEVAYSSSVQIPNEDVENSTQVCIVMEHEKNSRVKPTSCTKNCLETNVNDFSERKTASEVKEIVSDETWNALSLAQSVSENSVLEHTIFERDTAEREDEIVEMPIQKRKRNRRGKRKHKRTSSSIHASLDLNTDHSNVAVSSNKPSFINTVLHSRKHMRFSDSGDDEEVSAPPKTENNSIDTSGRNESCSSEANGFASIATRSSECAKPSSKLGKACMVEASSVGDEKRKKDVDPHDQGLGKILRCEPTDGVKMSKKTSCEAQSNSLPVGGRRKKAVLNTGLGATLAHLMKNVKKSEVCDSVSKISNVMTVVPTQPPPSKPDQQSSSCKNYTEFPIIEKFPREGDILAFKMLKMNDQYEPCISSFIESVVTACDQNQSMVTMRILEGGKEFNRINGKFDIQLDGEEEKTESKDVVLIMEWKDVIEPRLIFP